MTSLLIVDSVAELYHSHESYCFARSIHQAKVSRGRFILTNRSHLIKGLFFFSFLVFLLCGCGGGGGGKDGDNPGNNDPLQNADISGQWRSTITAESGTVYQTYLNLTQDDSHIGGTLHWDCVFTDETNPSDDVSGAVDHSSVTLSVMVRNSENTDDYLEFAYEGTANDSEISGDVTITGEWDGTSIDDRGSFSLYKYIIEVSTEIAEPTTWESRYVYVLPADLYINSTLTIQPGTVIKSQSGIAIHVREEGSILAQGTSDARIAFTSYKDDDHGGDTNNNGSTSAPGMGDWDGTIIHGSQGSVFDYCHFLYSGVTYHNSALKLDDSQAAISNCVFAHNGGGFCSYRYIGALDASNARLGTTINANRFFNNSLPLSINHNFDLDDTNTFHDASGTVLNTSNAIFFHNNASNYWGHINRNLRWGETEVAIVIDLTSCRLLSNTSLTLEDNVVLKFISGCQFNLVDGENALNNHDGEGVYFTSFKDDSLKGDSNGNGDATSPADNDWGGIISGRASNGPPITGWSNVFYAETAEP